MSEGVALLGMMRACLGRSMGLNEAALDGSKQAKDNYNQLLVRYSRHQKRSKVSFLFFDGQPPFVSLRDPPPPLCGARTSVAKAAHSALPLLHILQTAIPAALL